MELSILDQSPIRRDSMPETALKESVELAVMAETLGYKRYWLAEHHNTNGLASTAPEILAAAILGATETIKVGTGGVLLPQYSPLKVAEQFNLLTGLYPDRVDLGVGRSPGGSEITRKALADGASAKLKEFPRMLKELQGFLHNSLPRDHAYRMVKAAPRIAEAPPLWLLGLSENSAKLAASEGIGYVFGHFISPDNGTKALPRYRENFEPGPSFDKPYSIACIFVVCAETEQEAQELAESQDHWLLSVGKGRDTKVPSPEFIVNKELTAADQETIKQNRKRCIIGDPDQVWQQLKHYQSVYQCDEIMLITNIYDQQAKQDSYRLIMEKAKGLR